MADAPDTPRIPGPDDGRVVAFTPQLDLSNRAILAAAEALEKAGVFADSTDFHWRVLDELGVPPATPGRALRGLGTMGNRHISMVLNSYREGARAADLADGADADGTDGADR